MAMENKRIIQLNTERTTPATDDYVMVDSATAGTAKYLLPKITDAIDQEISDRTSADTTLQGNITAEATARAAADTAINGEITQLKEDLSEQTRNILDINKWTSANASMSVSDGIASNIKTDTRTYLQFCVWLYNGSSYISTVYDASETTRKKNITFTASNNADKLRIKHNGAIQDLYIDIPVQISSGVTYTLSINITGANPTVIGGVSFDEVQLEDGSTASPYVPYISATDYIAREEIDGIKEDENYLFDEVYAARFLLTAADYLTLEGKYIGTTGAIADSANHNASDYIRVHNGDVLSYTLRGSDSGAAVVYLYDADKNPVQSVALGTAYNQDVTGTYTAEIDGFVRICTRVDHDNPVFEIGSSGQLLGIKKLISDSIESVSEIPEYWEAHVADAISRYKAKSVLVGNHGVSFGFVSDSHWYYNAKNSAKILNYVCGKTDLDTIVHGGDFLRYEAEEIIDFTKDIDKSLKFLPVIGNHEYDSSVGITTDEVYAFAFKRSESIYTHISGFNYCYDNSIQKVRFISLNYNDSSCISLLETWTSELASGWSVIVLCHMYWEGAVRGSEPTITTIGASIANKIDTLNGTIAAEIILYLCGHVHRDLNATTGDGVPIVSINCDAYSDYQSYNWGGYKMYADDTTSQCIDLVNIDTTARKIYMTRIGVGQDREFTY